MPAPQTYKNHTRWDPLFHYFLMPVFVLNVVVTVLWYVRHQRSHEHTGPWAILLSLALVMVLAKTRLYALQVQDRVIRLEEKQRLAALVSASELIELDSLTIKQYVALRFASNAELPDLARRTIRENLTPKQIKEAIVSWRPDYDRV
jgi:hypothetical protein